MLHSAPPSPRFIAEILVHAVNELVLKENTILLGADPQYLHRLTYQNEEGLQRRLFGKDNSLGKFLRAYINTFCLEKEAKSVGKIARCA